MILLLTCGNIVNSAGRICTQAESKVHMLNCCTILPMNLSPCGEMSRKEMQHLQHNWLVNL